VPARILRHNIFTRLFGIPATPELRDDDAWTYADGRVIVLLSRTPDLTRQSGAVRIEHDQLPAKLLVVHGEDGTYRAYRNECGHSGRCVDPVPGAHMLRCCSIGKTTYDYDGAVVSGPAMRPLETYPAYVEGDRLVIAVDQGERPKEA